MELIKSNDGRSLTIVWAGSVDATNIAGIEEALFKELDGVTEVTFDLEKLEYVSSSGLRALLKTQKRMKTQGRMVIKNVNDDIMEILKTTGFVRFLTII